jgi:hypothetical protein
MKPSRPASASASKPTLEELLRLKRAERPDEQFWAHFERDLRQRQLAEIIEPRPWWLGLSLLARRRGVGAGMGAGALAALVLGWGGLGTQLAQRGPAKVALSPQVGDVSAQAFGAPSEADGADGAVARSLTAGVDAVEGQAAFAPEETFAQANFESLGAALASGERGQSSVSETVNSTDWLTGVTQNLGTAGFADRERTRTVSTVSTARYAPQASALADVSGADQAALLVQSGWANQGLVSEDEPQSFSSSLSETWSELSSVAKRPANRQERLLATIAQVEEPSDAAASRPLGQVRDRVTHRLADDEALYASVTRLGLSADRLSVRF